VLQYPNTRTQVFRWFHAVPLFGSVGHPVVSELQDVDVDVDALKPLDALQLLAKWKGLV